jgi:hypothetical protein
VDVFEIVRYIPESERPSSKPIPPMPVCQDSGTEEEWEAYWIKRDAYFNGIQLRKI